MRNGSMNVENDNVQEAIDNIMTDIFETLTSDSEQRHIFGPILQLLANGRLVSPDEVAFRLHTSPDKVTSTLKKFGVSNT